MKKLSVAIITRNEAEHLEECLKSVSWAEEIIIVDDYSTDATLEIAKKYTDKIYQRRLDGFGKQRQFALENSTGDWVLSLDADEKVSEPLGKEILEITDKEKDDFQGYFLPRRNYYFGRWLKWGGKYPDWQLHFFKRDKAKFSGLIHEKLEINGKTGKLKGWVEHYTYSDINELLRKLGFFTDFRALVLLEKGINPSIFNSWRYLFWRPGTRFFRRYFLKLGFLDGYPGLLACIHDIFTEIFTYFKLWEKKKKK